MNSITVAAQETAVTVSAAKYSAGSGSITISISDSVIERLWGVEKIGYELSVESTEELVKQLREKISWVKGE